MMKKTIVQCLIGIVIISATNICLQTSALRMKRSTYQNPDCVANIKQNGMSLLNEGIRTFDPSIKISGRFFEALKDLYEHSDKEMIYNKTIAGLLRVHTNHNFSYEHFVNSSITTLEFRFIYVYTSKTVYQILNKSLREHNCTKKYLSEKEKNIAPFTAMLMAVLMYWPALRQETGNVYRKINLTDSDLKLYQVGVQFTWTQFISTTRIREKAFDGSVEFIIHNGNRNSFLGPKKVMEYAWFPSLDEVVYCPGAEYKVTKVHEPIDNITTVELEYIALESTSRSVYRLNKL